MKKMFKNFIDDIIHDTNPVLRIDIRSMIDKFSHKMYFPLSCCKDEGCATILL